MKVTVIGCWGGYPKAGEATSGYLIEQEGYRLLVDCGSAVLSNLQRYIKAEEIDFCVISHYHFDHTADIGPLQYARQIKGRLGANLTPLIIYGPKEDSLDFKRLTMKGVTEGRGYIESEKITLGPLSISFCKTRHPVSCYAMKVSVGQKSLVYTSDSSYFDGLAEFSKGASLIICECNLYKDQDGSVMGHMNSSDAARLAQKAGAGSLLLTHLPQYGNLEDLKKDAAEKFSGHVDMASAGWSIEL